VFFGAGCESPGDFIADTPYEAEPSFECPVGANTCGARPGLDPINNFMDYTDDCCMYIFSPQQILVMQANVIENREAWLVS
jgi:hypothetical protein